MSSSILYHHEAAITTLTLNRPEVLNALNPELAHALHQALLRASEDRQTRCIVIQGEGDGFMSGGDVAFFRDSLARLSSDAASLLASVFDDVHAIIRLISTMPKPVIAGVHGATAGFGVSLVAACDLAVAADNSVFSMAYCQLGTSPDGGSTWFLPRNMGIKRAKELLYLGDRFDAHHARMLGLINRIVPAKTLGQEIQTLAERLANGPAEAIARTKSLINHSMDASLEQQLEAEQRSFIECVQTADFAEGVTAFCQKKKPAFNRQAETIEE